MVRTYLKVTSGSDMSAEKRPAKCRHLGRGLQTERTTSSKRWDEGWYH